MIINSIILYIYKIGLYQKNQVYVCICLEKYTFISLTYLNLSHIHAMDK